MGNTVSQTEQLKQSHQYEFLYNNKANRSVWRTEHGKQIEEYPIFSTTEIDIDLFRELYYLRKDTPELVQAHHFQEIQRGGLCSLAAQGKLFLQKIDIRLSDFEQVPYPDVLHLYYNALVGYRQLVKRVGLFRINDQQIGLTSQGQARVWLDSDFSGITPSTMEQSEQTMVRSLLEMIEDNTDLQTFPVSFPSVVDFICKNNLSGLNFDTALISLRQYVNCYNNGQIPKYMECIKQVGVQNILKNLTLPHFQKENDQLQYGNSEKNKSEAFNLRSHGRKQSNTQLSNTKILSEFKKTTLPNLPIPTISTKTIISKPTNILLRGPVYKPNSKVMIQQLRLPHKNITLTKEAVAPLSQRSHSAVLANGNFLNQNPNTSVSQNGITTLTSQQLSNQSHQFVHALEGSIKNNRKDIGSNSKTQGPIKIEEVGFTKQEETSLHQQKLLQRKQHAEEKETNEQEGVNRRNIKGQRHYVQEISDLRSQSVIKQPIKEENEDEPSEPRMSKEPQQFLNQEKRNQSAYQQHEQEQNYQSKSIPKTQNPASALIYQQNSPYLLQQSALTNAPPMARSIIQPNKQTMAKKNSPFDLSHISSTALSRGLIPQNSRSFLISQQQFPPVHAIRESPIMTQTLIVKKPSFNQHPNLTFMGLNSSRTLIPGIQTGRTLSESKLGSLGRQISGQRQVRRVRLDDVTILGMSGKPRRVSPHQKLPTISQQQIQLQRKQLMEKRSKAANLSNLGQQPSIYQRLDQFSTESFEQVPRSENKMVVSSSNKEFNKNRQERNIVINKATNDWTTKINSEQNISQEESSNKMCQDKAKQQNHPQQQKYKHNNLQSLVNNQNRFVLDSSTVLVEIAKNNGYKVSSIPEQVDEDDNEENRSSIQHLSNYQQKIHLSTNQQNKYISSYQQKIGQENTQGLNVKKMKSESNNPQVGSPISIIQKNGNYQGQIFKQYLQNNQKKSNDTRTNSLVSTTYNYGSNKMNQFALRTYSLENSKINIGLEDGKTSLELLEQIRKLSSNRQANSSSFNDSKFSYNTNKQSPQYFSQEKVEQKNSPRVALQKTLASTKTQSIAKNFENKYKNSQLEYGYSNFTAYSKSKQQSEHANNMFAKKGNDSMAARLIDLGNKKQTNF